MKTQISLQPRSGKFECSPINQLPSFSSLKIASADAKLMKFEEGQLLMQSFSHYMAYIELFEYQLTQDVCIDITVKKSSFFMFIMLSGHSSFCDSAGNVISETHGNNCTLSYIQAGNYSRKFLAGTHRMLLLTFSTEWFLRKCECMDGLIPLAEAQSNAEPYCLLPHCPMALALFNSFEKFNTVINIKNHPEMDVQGLLFINECVNSYHEKLINVQYDTYTLHRQKAYEVEEFIKNNFTEKIVDDGASMAKIFMVSEKTLSRLAKMAFNRPLHKQVMEFRLMYAFEALLVTKKPIHEIAASIGYSDPHYFSRAFKNRFGISPNKMR